LGFRREKPRVSEGRSLEGLVIGPRTRIREWKKVQQAPANQTMVVQKHFDQWKVACKTHMPWAATTDNV